MTTIEYMAFLYTVSAPYCKIVLHEMFFILIGISMSVNR